MAKEKLAPIRGTLTPAEVRAAIHKICKERNYDPFDELIQLATETQEVEINGKTITVPLASVDQKITIAKEIASYIAPKLRSVEIEAHMDSSWTIKIQKFGENTAKEVLAPEATKRFMKSAIEEGKLLAETAALNDEDEDA